MNVVLNPAGMDSLRQAAIYFEQPPVVTYFNVILDAAGPVAMLISTTLVFPCSGRCSHSL